jgi:SAM-dependent methyltransferase
MDTVRALTKPLKADRLLPPLPGTPPEAFERLYAERADPWGVLLSPIAHQRYLALVEAVGAHTPCDSILDVGCGEGSFTRYLVGQARHVVGIDASQTAIERARRLVPKAAFWCGMLESFNAPETFDVVLAIEVLYYVPDVKIALDKLLALGRTVFVAYTSRERSRIEAHLDRLCPPESRIFHPFFGLKNHGFTIACLRGRRDAI